MNLSLQLPTARSLEGRVAGALGFLGFLLIVFADQVARSLARLLPGRAEVSSGGTAFPQFAEVMPTIVHRNGLLLIVVAIAIVASRGLQRRERVPAWAGPALAIVCVIGTAVWIGWLATPHNAFPSNARIHWVDYLTDKSDNYFYAAGRIPHVLFYESPPIWQAFNASILVALAITVARQLGARWIMAVSFGLVVATSGNLLRFANTAEDVFINLTLVFTVIAASLRRGPVVLGFALAAVLLGRPQFAVIFPAIAAAELLASARRRQWPDRNVVRYVGTTAAVTAAGIAVCQVLFTILGRRYFFANGNFVDIEELSNVTPREIDGFIISPLSGAYALHLPWVLPTASLLLALVGVIRAHHLELRREVTVYFCLFSVLALIALHEMRPLLYFNIRYLTYLMPFILVMGWAAVMSLERATTKDRHPWLAPLAAVAVLAPMTIPADAVDLKRRLDNRPETALLDVRSELRDVTNGETVYLNFVAASSRNYVAYILRRPVSDVILVADTDGEPDGFVISSTDTPWNENEPVLTTEGLAVYSTDQPDD